MKFSQKDLHDQTDDKQSLEYTTKFISERNIRIPLYFKRAHQFSSKNREELKDSQLCGCFLCLEIYEPKTIKTWKYGNCTEEDSALCPECSVDVCSVIGSSSGYPIDKTFLENMNYYFK